jgi:hypothetical protein
MPATAPPRHVQGSEGSSRLFRRRRRCRRRSVAHRVDDLLDCVGHHLRSFDLNVVAAVGDDDVARVGQRCKPVLRSLRAGARVTSTRSRTRPPQRSPSRSPCHPTPAPRPARCRAPSRFRPARQTRAARASAPTPRGAARCNLGRAAQSPQTRRRLPFADVRASFSMWFPSARWVRARCWMSAGSLKPPRSSARCRRAAAVDDSISTAD